jgi:phosphate-selective porin OprO/OprP
VSCPRPGATPSAAANKRVYTVGLNWYPNSNLRFLFDYLHGKLDNRFSSAAGGGIAGIRSAPRVGGEFDAVVMRTQIRVLNHSTSKSIPSRL